MHTISKTQSHIVSRSVIAFPMMHLPVFALAVSNFSAFLPLRKALMRRDKLTALLVFSSFFSSFVYHGFYDNARGDAQYLRVPFWLLADRVCAILYTLRLFSLRPRKSTYLKSMQLAIPASFAGIGSEMFTIARIRLICSTRYFRAAGVVNARLSMNSELPRLL